MDNIPRSLPKRSFTSYSNVAFTSHKSAYDGVFGASPKFRLLTLAPRLEEFSEIFGGFHASRSFSLPILDLSLIGDDSNLLHFDRDFDYTEVFGDSRCVGFASSEDLVGQSSGRYDSSDEPWSPAQSGSLSDEFDALAGSDKSKNIGTVLTETSHVTKFSSLPGYTFSHYGSPVSLDGEDENCSVSVVSDLNSCKEYGKRVTEEKQYTKYSANSVHSGLNSPRSDFNLLEKHGNSTSKPFMIVSDISLRTKPSRLPPPSRPPPALVVKKLDSDRSGLKLKASKSYDFERVSDDSASLSFDVEVDSTLSPEDRENGNKNVKSKHESTKESIERKDMQVEEKRNKTARVSNSIMEEMPESHGKETTTSLPVIEDTIESSRGIEDISGSEEVRYCNLHGVDNSAGPVAWREATEYYEVIEKNASQEAFDTTMLHMDRDAYRHRSTTGYDTFDGQEDWKKLKVSKEAQGLEEERMQQFGESKRLQADHTETAEVRAEAKGNLSEVDAKSKPKAFPKGVDVDFSKRFIDAQIIKQSIVEHKQSILTEECSRKLEDMEGAETKERVKLRTEPEGIKKQHTGAFVKEKDPNENEMTSKEVKEHGESDKKSYIAAGLEKTGDGQLACEVEKDRERLMEAGKHIKNELTYRDAPQQVSGEKEDKLHHTKEVTKERSGNTSKTEESGLRFRRADIDAGNMVEIFKINRHMNLSRAGGVQENLSGHAEEIEPIERNQSEKEVERDVDTYFLIEEDQLEEFNAGCKLDEAVATKVSGKHDNEGVDSTLVKGKSNGFSKNGNEFQDGITHGAANNNVESSCLPKQMTDSNIRGSGMGTSFVRTDSDRIFSALACSHESEKIMSSEDDQRPQIKGTQFIRKMVDIGDTFTPCQVIRESTVNGRKVEDASSVLKHSDDTLYSIKNVASQRIERKGYNMKENLTAKEQKVGDRIRREIELENEHIRKIEEEKERERERVKDRMAVDKGAIEARERSYAATRERTERAALERATAEVRQRAMAGARERLEKASMETKLRAERAAVERATAEARQRAAEKLVAQKPAFEANDRVERSVPDKFSAHFPSADTRQNSSSFDIHLQSAGISNSLRYSYSSAHVGGESPQRCKARLERYRRTADRAATALAEKNNRDLLAQREREEMNRVAESLHAEVKRWSSGKEGNLRSLLSTLQYILGPDSSWQPVPLTEIITSAAVKKAYRKATLCVHPDKLQQRGASVQQKYICEKVFDLLKEAWNKFNSEER